MLRIRKVEEAIAKRYGEKEMRCPVHLSIGQEGVAVGVCSALETRDVVLSTHRGHAHYLAKGGSLKKMLAEIYGKGEGCCRGRGGSMHLNDVSVNMLASTPIVGSSLPVAVGVAFAHWLDQTKTVTAVFFGEGATEEGVFLECINFASLKKLPILFVCENNLYSVYSPMSVRQSAVRDRAAIAKAHGIQTYQGNGNDVEAVFGITKEALCYAREGLGPCFLEFTTYRWREHCGPHYDNHIGYRTEEEFLMWKKRCPVENYQRKILAEKILSEAEVAQRSEQMDQEISEAFAFARETPFPEPRELRTQIYADEK